MNTNRAMISALAGVLCVGVIVGCASTSPAIDIPEDRDQSEHHQDRALSQSEADHADDSSGEQASKAKSKIAKGLGRIVEGPFAGAYVGTGAGYLPTMPGLIGGAVVGGLVGLVTGVQIMITGEDPLDKNASETLQCDPPACEEPNLSNAMAVASTEQNKVPAQTINCKTRYCGNYYGYLIAKGPSRSKKIPIKVTVSDGTITSAIAADKVGACHATNAYASASQMANSGEFSGKYEAVCEYEKMGSCRVIGVLKGYVNSPSNPVLPDELLLSGSSKFTCSHGNQEVHYSVSTTQSAPGTHRTPSEEEKLLISSKSETFVDPLLSAGVTVVQSGH